ncbi:hypothetical protein AZE42_07377 [Rhizopogon vesiculosus]|uniref:Uncharacterized protein n=1 Tax=Rhizopogon vesiculosus TaxID=180088 RepID=A0A1J8PQC0_9AGAM|nr:hypothetical protein AZE42_07377 [Rhizopogon vesiculosus]
MSVVYDYETGARDDPLVLLVVDVVDVGITMMTPERAMILKLFPFLLNLPDWCPGSSIKRDARILTNLTNKMVNVPFDYVKQHMADNSISSQSSMVGEHLQRIEEQDDALKPIFESALKKAASTAFAGE